MPALIRPTTSLQESYLDAIAEYQAEGRYAQLSLPALRADLSAHVAELLAQEALASQMIVPMSVLWLVEGEDYLGRGSIRHYLNNWLRRVGGHIGYDIRPSRRRLGHGTRILALALPEARRLGLTRVLVTCDEDNVGSARIIERSGGVLEDILVIEGLPRAKRRYWIEL